MKFKQLVSVSIITFITYATFAQSKIPEPKTDTYSINGFNPSSNGFILTNLQFASKVVLDQPQPDKLEWKATVSFKSCTVEGYLYNGATYSKSQLINDFGLTESHFQSVTLKSVTVTFNNGKSFKTNSLGLRGFDYSNLAYSKGDENTDFNIREIAIVTASGLGIESKIKDGLVKKETLKNKETKSIKNENSNNSSSNTSNSTSNTGSNNNQYSQSNNSNHNSNRSLSEAVIGSWVSVTLPGFTLYLNSNGTGYNTIPDSNRTCYPYYWKAYFNYSLNNSSIIQTYTSIDNYCGDFYSPSILGSLNLVIESSGEILTDGEGNKYTRK